MRGQWTELLDNVSKIAVYFVDQSSGVEVLTSLRIDVRPCQKGVRAMPMFRVGSSIGGGGTRGPSGMVGTAVAFSKTGGRKKTASKLSFYCFPILSTHFWIQAKLNNHLQVLLVCICRCCFNMDLFLGENGQ